MAALTNGRLTPTRTEGGLRTFQADAGVKIFEGALVVLDGGFAQPGNTATGLVSVGIALEAVDNSGGAQGAAEVRVKRCVARFANSAAADAVTAAEIGATCYVVDDQTVAKTNGTNTRSAAGRVYDVDAQGVWVEFTA